VNPPTLNDLFGLKAGDVQKAWDEARVDNPKFASATSGIAGAAADSVAEALGDALTTDFYSLLGHVWVQYAKVKEAAMASLADPGDLKKLPLGKHDFTHTVYPTVTLYVGEQELPDIRFTLELVAQIESVVLGIRHAAVESVSGARGAVQAQLKYKNQTLKKMQSRSIELTEFFKLRKPVPILDTRPR